MTAAAAHLDAAAWTLAASFIAFVVMIAIAVATSWIEHRQPRRQIGVFEAVFALRRANAIDAGEAETILNRYDAVDAVEVES